MKPVGIWMVCKDQMICAICLDDEPSRWMSTRCGHKFHRHCFRRLIDNDHDCCPICRELFYPEQTRCKARCVFSGLCWIATVILLRLFIIMCLCAPLIGLVVLVAIPPIQGYFLFLMLALTVRILCFPVPRDINHII